MVYQNFMVFWQLNENNRQAKMLRDQGKLTEEEYQKLLEMDPSPTKKYVGWLAKVYTSEEINIDDLPSVIQEFDTFVRTNIIRGEESNIQKYKSYSDLIGIVDKINNEGSNITLKSMEKDLSVIVDNDQIRIVSPYSHAASRKLGLTPLNKSGYAFRECGDGSGSFDSAWCTTYKTPAHWNDYYYTKGIDFYYILIKGAELKNKLKSAGFTETDFVMALSRIPIDHDKEIQDQRQSVYGTKNNKGQRIFWTANDAKDQALSRSEIIKYFKILNIK